MRVNNMYGNVDYCLIKSVKMLVKYILLIIDRRKNKISINGSPEMCFSTKINNMYERLRSRECNNTSIFKIVLSRNNYHL